MRTALLSRMERQREAAGDVISSGEIAPGESEIVPGTSAAVPSVAGGGEGADLLAAAAAKLPRLRGHRLLVDLLESLFHLNTHTDPHWGLVLP